MINRKAVSSLVWATGFAALIGAAEAAPGEESRQMQQRVLGEAVAAEAAKQADYLETQEREREQQRRHVYQDPEAAGAHKREQIRRQERQQTRQGGHGNGGFGPGFAGGNSMKGSGAPQRGRR